MRTDADNANCYSSRICGTLKYASSAANFYSTSSRFNFTDIEIIIQGQNPDEINASLLEYEANGVSANPCMTRFVSEYCSFYLCVCV